MSTFYLITLPETAAPGSYVSTFKVRGGTWNVEVRNCISVSEMRLAARWRGKSQGEAALIAQLVATRGYEWRRR